MRRTRGDSLLPLISGALVAVLLHALLLPGAAVYGWGSGGGSLKKLQKVAADEPEEERDREDETAVGREESSASSVAWIAYDDFRELMARKAETEQPALQQMVDPTESAPPVLDATPPAPTAPPLPQPPAPTAAESTPELATLLPRAEARALPLPAPTLPGDLRVPFERRPLELRPQEAQVPADAAQAAAPPPQEATPTSAPRSDRESPPTQRLRETVEWQSGAVRVPRGIEIKPVAPRFSAVTRSIAAPINPEAILHFDGSGRVLRVDLVVSSGWENVDGPVIAALYKWRASGRRVEALREGQTLEVPVRMLFNPD